jgi:hypothetical protein
MRIPFIQNELCVNSTCFWHDYTLLYGLFVVAMEVYFGKSMLFGSRAMETFSLWSRWVGDCKFSWQFSVFELSALVHLATVTLFDM